MDKQIIYYYQRGVASYLIAKKLGISNSYARDMLKKHGIKLRGHSITNKISASKRTPLENKLITAKASKKNKGSTHSPMHRSKLALSRQNNPNIDKTYEQPLVDACKKNNILVIPQKAFYKYNVDLYFVKQNLAIEIFGGGFHNKKQAVDMFKNKLKYLSSRNIPVLIIWADKINYSPHNIIKCAMSISNMVTIINGDGTPTTRGLSDIVFNN